MKFEKIKGLIDAPFTPFLPNGEVNYDIIPQYAALLARNGLKGVFINGSSGEGYMLTEEERMQLAEAWVKAVPADFKVIVHVGSTMVKSSRRLAEHAQKIGAWGIGAMATPFPRIGRIEELVKYCEEIAAGAPNLPFFFYHIPAFNGCFLSMYDFLKAAVFPILQVSSTRLKVCTNTIVACAIKTTSTICSTVRTKPFCPVWLWAARKAALAAQLTITAVAS